MTSHKHAKLPGQTITIPGVTLPFVQNYTYDSLNRLESAEEKPSGWSNCTADPTKCWKQTFKYDRYGNRNFDTTGTNTTTLPANFDPKIYNPTRTTTGSKQVRDTPTTRRATPLAMPRAGSSPTTLRTSRRRARP